MRYVEIREQESAGDRTSRMAKARSKLDQANDRRVEAARQYQDKMRSANDAAADAKAKLRETNRLSLSNSPKVD